MNKKEAKEFLQEFTPRMFWESLSSMLICHNYKLIKINIVAERNVPSKKKSRKKQSMSATKSDNTESAALALCKRAVAHVCEVGDLPKGHPIITEMVDLLAQQHMWRLPAIGLR